MEYCVELSCWELGPCPKHGNFVPSWLQGVWERVSIARANAEGVFGLPDTSVRVRYVQTPWAFVDIRCALEKGKCQGEMAFGGVTSVTEQLVRWHACVNFQPPIFDPLETWRCAVNGEPQVTADQGLMQCISDISQTYVERALDNSYEEVWRKLSHGEGRFLAVRRGASLLVVAGDYFNFAQDDRIRGKGGICEYVGGTVSSGWRIDISVGGVEGTLTLPGSPAEWTRLPGSTMHWPLANPPEFIASPPVFDL